LEREIREQPRCLSNLLERYLPGRALGPVAPAGWRARGEGGPIRLIGCGTAFHAAQIGALLFERIAQVPARAQLASAFERELPLLRPDERIIAVSQSGESTDTVRALRELQEASGPSLAITRGSDSTLARTAHDCLETHSGIERAIPSTKGFTTQVLLLYLLALDERRHRTGEPPSERELADLAALPAQVEQTLAVGTPFVSHSGAFQDARLVFYLGDGLESAVAREGALKLSETALVPTASYPSPEIRHGALALLGDDTPVVLLGSQPANARALERLARELTACGAPLFVIGASRPQEAWPRTCMRHLVCAAASPLHALVTVLPLQLLALHIGVARGCDVDRPRNLSKSVQVE